MKSQSYPETVSTQFIEQDCTISHEGMSFTAGGAVVTDDALVAYPGEGGILNDWHGRAIGKWSVRTSRRAIFFGRRSWMGETFYTMNAWVNGRRYLLRGFGIGMIAKGRSTPTPATR